MLEELYGFDNEMDLWGGRASRIKLGRDSAASKGNKKRKRDGGCC